MRARELGAVIVNDECYAELDWESEDATPSILDPRVTQGSRRLTLSVYSLSKQSNLAGYRAGIVAGCSDLIGELLAVRKHLGLMPPAPVQAAMIVALGDRRARRRAEGALPRPPDRAWPAALEGAGFRIDDSRAGLYLWATRGEDAWASVDALAAHRHPGHPGHVLRAERRGSTCGSRSRRPTNGSPRRPRVWRGSPKQRAGPLADATLVPGTE